MTQKLALAGGKAVRSKPFTEWPVFGPEERENLLRVFDSGKWWYGEQVQEFERRYAEFQDAKYGVTFANGTLALEAAMAANGIGAGDEVIVPPYTFMATARYLDEQLKGMSGLGLMRGDSRVTRRSYHMYVFRHLAEKWDGITREMFLAALEAEGIPASFGYPAPLYKNPVFSLTGDGPRNCPRSCPFYGQPTDYQSVVCPNTEQICREACWIPHAVLLGDESDMRDIVMAITKVWEQRESLRKIKISQKT
ncbi:MAG: DegT/DnrJ/EryC1/StrS family aminotransferase [Kiritimatiellia bacterium]|jgi:dTDP-4-amino-4,6-dideoxygalactose transaminase